MKKLFLFTAALAAFSTVQAQQKRIVQQPELNSRLTATVDIASKTAANGDTIVRSNITSADTPTFYVTDFVAPLDSGYLTGYNAVGSKAYAELYRINNAGTPDSSISVIGMYTYLYGRASANSTKNVVLTAWSSGQPTNPVPSRPRIFFSGKPDAVIGSRSIPLKAFSASLTAGGRINKDTFIFFQTPSTYTNRSFYAGIQLPNYNWSNLAGDTAILISTQDGERRSNSYGYISGQDTTYLMQNVVQQSNNTWVDFYQEHPFGIAFHLYALPIIKIRITSAVSGVTKNELTVHGTFPNPAANNSNLKLTLASATNVTVDLMDLTGRKVRQIHSGNLGAGVAELPIQTSDLANGNYILMIRTAKGDGMGLQMTVAH